MTPRRDFLILAAGILPALVLGVAWMRHAGVPFAVYLQNVAAAVVGAAIAAFVSRRRVSAAAGFVVTGLAILLLLATLLAGGVSGVHRWLRLGPLSIHVASLAVPPLLVELDRVLRRNQVLLAFCVVVIVMIVLILQPDAGQATAFAGASIVLLAMHLKRGVAFAAMLVLVGLAAGSFFRSDPLAPVPYVEEIAVRIAQEGVAGQIGVGVALVLLIVPFVVQAPAVSRAGGGAVAVYLALAIAASFWGSFPVPILGYGMSPILGHLAGWAWLRATWDGGTTNAGEDAGVPVKTKPTSPRSLHPDRSSGR